MRVGFGWVFWFKCFAQNVFTLATGVSHSDQPVCLKDLCQKSEASQNLKRVSRSAWAIRPQSGIRRCYYQLRRYRVPILYTVPRIILVRVQNQRLDLGFWCAGHIIRRIPEELSLATFTFLPWKEQNDSFHHQRQDIFGKRHILCSEQTTYLQNKIQWNPPALDREALP